MNNIEQTRRLDTKQAAEFLTSLGFKTAPATLCKLRCVGGSAAYESFGRKPLYTEASLLEWVRQKTSSLRRSTSDNGGHHAE